jgi:xanthine dehydrogenase YagR molybdenum-binding subunit
MLVGLGSAIMEELVIDQRAGYFINRDLPEYQVRIHADSPFQEIVFIDELDDKSSPMKAKGVGELGVCGSGAAIANAIYIATGIRILDYPITLAKLLPGLPPLA